MENLTKYIVYILSLEQGKYYVGKTKNLTKRIEVHQAGRGSEWTKKYPLLKENPYETFLDCDNFDEDKITIKYMDKFGRHNVRGGSFTQVKLPQEQITVLKTMLKTSSDKCYECGRHGHYANECPRRYRRRINSFKCYNCGQIGHHAFECQTVGFTNDDPSKEGCRIM